MKKFLHKLVVLSIMAIAMVMWTMPVRGQTYQLIYWDNHFNGEFVPYCQTTCDSIKCVPPTGVTGIYWTYPGNTVYSDTLVLPSGFYDQVNCYYNGGLKTINLVPINPPQEPFLSLADTICGIGTITLDAGNYSPYPFFTTYLWNTSVTSQTITVVDGIYWVEISNACGSISDTITIVEYNPNPPDLGPDTILCQGSLLLLDPGTGYSDYLWTPGGSTNSYLMPTTSGIYIVQTTNAIGGCVDLDTVQVTFLIPPVQDIALVTIDTSNGNNRVTWENLYGEAVTTKIYRELTTNNYVEVGTAPYGDGTWTDTVNSRNQPWRYKISIVDTCANEGDQSLYVQSIHTWVSEMGGNYTVQWTPYLMEAKDVVDQYNIYYGSQLSQLIYLTFVSGSVTVYTTTGFIDSLYVVGAQLSAKGVNDDALSNWIAEDDAVGITENETVCFDIFPNPAVDVISIPSQENLIIHVSDLAGRNILSTQKKEIDVSNIPAGVYMICVINTFTGEAGYKKLIITH